MEIYIPKQPSAWRSAVLQRNDWQYKRICLVLYIMVVAEWIILWTTRVKNIEISDFDLLDIGHLISVTWYRSPPKTINYIIQTNVYRIKESWE